MKILAVGGGSGGHVTPVAAVLSEVAKVQPEGFVVRFVCDKAFEQQSRGIMATLPFPVEITTIPSGKLRRYAHFSWWHYIRHFSIVLHNVVDMLKTAAGFFAALWIIMRFRPDVVFAKGGYVCLPVGMAARLLRVPLVIHDSDVRPGLTNKVLARFAAAIGTGMPLEHYDYKRSISHYVGVPISPDIVPTTPGLQTLYREELGLALDSKLVVAVGGGLGSVVINHATIEAAKRVSPDAGVLYYNVTGVGNIDTAREQAGDTAAYQAVPFIYSDMHKVLGAADVVVTRASATTLQELAGLQKAVIAVPAKQLGDQQQNAQFYAQYDAVVALRDDTLTQELPGVVNGLLADDARRAELAHNLHAFAKPTAARDMATLIINEATKA